jgi:ATP-dependent Clp protease ATP-binding subunit ClpA
LDGIDKAHRDCRLILHEILEEGRITDGLGRTVSFKETVLLLTTLVGYAEPDVTPDLVAGADANHPYEVIGATGKAAAERLNRAREAVEGIFPPEFLRGLTDLNLLR